MKSKNILVAGGSGTIGKAFANAAFDLGYQLRILSRSKAKQKPDNFLWSPNKGLIDEKAINWADVVINLAGAGIADNKWSNKRKQELIDSRILSTKILVDAINSSSNKPELFIQGTAIGIYGYAGSRLMTEESTASENDFLADLCVKWELETQRLSKDVRKVICRTGIVLNKESGIIPRMKAVAKFGILSPLGTGKQWLSWIHIEDLSSLLLYFIDHPECTGAYNAVAPIPVQNEVFAKGVNLVMKRMNLAPAVPSVVLKLLYGELASTFLGGQLVSNEKIQSLGFRFKYDLIVIALKDVLSK